MAEELNQRPGESKFDYHKRLVEGKLVDKTLSDVDYSELSEYVYGHHYSSDVARRMMYGSCRTIQLMEDTKHQELEADCASEEIRNKISELDMKKIELKKERQKFQDQRREYNKIINKEARVEHLESRLISAATDLSNTMRLYLEDIPYLNQDAQAESSDNEAVLVFSDWHYGLKTENIFNKFSVEICKKRVGIVVGKAIERIRLHSCKRLHIFVLGDLIHGAIHCSARVASEELVCDQLMQATELLAQAIECLSQYVEETVVYVTYGNHARTVANKNDNIHRDNMERIVPWWLNQRFKDSDRVVICHDEGNEFLFADVCGHGFCASHGDNDSVRTAPKLLPALFRKKYNRDIEYILLGDKHHRENYEEIGVSAYLCSSLCGTDDYANEKRLYSGSSQLLLIVNPELGVDAEYILRCNESD